jgi:hypothetical protein
MRKGADIVETYNNLGFVGPLKAFDKSELLDDKKAVMQELVSGGGSIYSNRNRHLDWALAKKYTHAPAITNAATQLLGPELKLWRTMFFLGVQGNGIRWHQDQYTGLLADVAKQVSIHLAITEATSDNCVMVLPGSHLKNRDGIANAGFTLIDGTDRDAYGAPNYWRNAGSKLEAVRMILKPGEFFVFHPLLLHASLDVTTPPSPRLTPPGPPARTLRKAQGVVRGASSCEYDYPRIGFALRITVSQNEVFEGAFAETAERGDYCVPMPARDEESTSGEHFLK